MTSIATQSGPRVACAPMCAPGLYMEVLCALLGQELFFWLENGLRKNLQKMVY
jgi:hypothetical protein